MKDENKQSINSRVAIYLDDDKTYTVRRADKGWTIQSGIKTPDEALAIKKAYVFGYVDGGRRAKTSIFLSYQWGDNYPPYRDSLRPEEYGEKWALTKKELKR